MCPILFCPGVYRYAGRDIRLTDIKGTVHKAILA
jgi:hypothetical protein